MNKIIVAGHRGFCAAAPENTMSAFRMSLETGADAVECDLRKTRDGRIVVIHDPSVDRTTNGTGLVAEMDFEDLRSLDAGSWFDAKYSGEKIPTLEEFLDLTKGKAIPVIEIKDSGIEDEVVAMIHQREMADQVMIIAGDWHIGVRLDELDPGIPFGPLHWQPQPPDDSEIVRIVDEAGAVNSRFLSAASNIVTPALVKTCHQANLHVQTWTVDTEEEVRRVVEAGVDCITTNKPDMVIGVLSEMGVWSEGARSIHGWPE